MTEYKLVPFEPTPEMVSAAADAHMPFGDMEMAIRMAILAAPAVQGEPGVKWAPEEVANGNKGIRWVSDEGVHGRPTDHDCRVYLESNPNARGCHCPECTMLAAAPAVEAEQAVVPTGFRVMKPTSSVVREGERWEIYAPCGSGGIVHEDEVTDWVVRKLLDALATAPQPVEQQPAPDVAGLVEALELALEYWRDRQQRYKNRRPKWVIAAEFALAAHRKGAQP